MTKVIRIAVFYPIHLILTLFLKLRHLMYDHGYFPSAETTVPTICIGNLELGGSGKTPMADFLLRKFAPRKKLAFLSRGYGRKTIGFQWLSECTGPDESGDEPWFLHQRWGNDVVFAVDENRLRGIFHILEKYPETDLIILDDAFQHRKIRTGYSILLTPFNKPFFRNYLFPAGNLRDIPSAARRADAICFTKAPEANQLHFMKVRKTADEAGFENTPVFVSSIVYGEPVNENNEFLPENKQITCISGLADNSAFFAYCRNRFNVSRFISLTDHYHYQADFFAERKITNDQLVLCTEKDFGKLKRVAPMPGLVFYLPIEISLYPEAEFLKIIEEHL